MSECDHILGIHIPGDPELLPSTVRASDPQKLDAIDEVFSFCPICGERVAPDDACSFYRTKNKTGGAPI